MAGQRNTLPITFKGGNPVSRPPLGTTTKQCSAWHFSLFSWPQEAATRFIVREMNGVHEKRKPPLEATKSEIVVNWEKGQCNRKPLVVRRKNYFCGISEAQYLTGQNDSSFSGKKQPFHTIFFIQRMYNKDDSKKITTPQLVGVVSNFGKRRNPRHDPPPKMLQKKRDIKDFGDTQIAKCTASSIIKRYWYLNAGPIPKGNWAKGGKIKKALKMYTVIWLCLWSRRIFCKKLCSPTHSVPRSIATFGRKPGKIALFTPLPTLLLQS